MITADKTYRRFYKTSIITIIAVYLLILVGGIVRTTGSGMGCPDWPKCFGRWVPPTNITQLPSNYKELFQVKGKKIADFNTFKTWTEYINRLVGVVIGFLILLTFLFSINYWKKDKVITIFCFFNLLLVGFQGWIGSVVVATHLASWIISIHMLIAIMIVFVGIYVIVRAKATIIEGFIPIKRLNIGLLIAVFLLLIQTILGTQVREAIDQIAILFNDQQRELWIGKLGLTFYIHRSFSLLVLLWNFYWVYQVRIKVYKESLLYKLGNGILFLLLIEVFSGIAMAYGSIPAYLQPLHMLLATLLLGIQFYMYLLVRNNLVEKDLSKFGKELVRI